MKRLNLLLVVFAILASVCHVSAQNADYTKWEKHDVKGLYKEVSAQEASQSWNVEVFEDGMTKRYFIPVRQDRGTYEVEVYEKVDSKFWGIHYTSVYMLFRFTPFLYKWDGGVLEWNGYDGVFYKKP